MNEVPETTKSNIEPRRLIQEIKRHDPFKPGEILLITAFVLVVILLVNFLIKEMKSRTNVNHAKAVASKVMADIQERNGNAAWALGTTSFQKTDSPAALTKLFHSEEIATLTPPSLDQQFSASGPAGSTYYFIYKYQALKVPFYIRIAIENKSGAWKLTQITGNPDESQLEG